MMLPSFRFLSALLCLAGALAAVSPAQARTRQVERQRGAAHRETTATNRHGQTTTRTTDRTWDPATQSGTIATETIRADGRRAGRSGTFQRNPDGSRSAEGTYERANGATGTYQTSTQPTEHGRTTQTTLTNAAGQTATVEAATTRTDDGFNRVTTKTGPQGNSVTKEVDVSRTGDGSVRTVTRTRSSAGE